MSVKAFARDEMRRANVGEEDSRVLGEIIDKFLDHFDSGGAVFVAMDVLRRLIGCQPLTPLTGADDEWMHGGPGPIFQNVRCASVFKDETGRCYDIDTKGRPTITFPYDPSTKGPPDPVMEI